MWRPLYSDIMIETLFKISITDVIQGKTPADAAYYVVWIATLLGVVIIGAAIGSFATVLCARKGIPLSKQKSRSVCPECGKMLTAGENIPILGWLLLRGKCKGCGKPIPPKYFISEITHAGIWILPLFFTGPATAAIIASAASAIIIPFQRKLWKNNKTSQQHYNKV
jgi:prepilin signal peptidase PulO-like enzyme (type II secretory pathway)